MNRHVNSIAGRLSLRAPLRHSLEILDRIMEIAPPTKDADVAALLAAIAGEFPSVTDFEREFPSICFAIATGVGKTRLMGAFISYLHLAHGKNNFFVLAPNLTIYNKLIADFTPNTPKYVFKGIAEFATDAPEIITGDSYEQRARTLFDETIRCKVNIFNISKINSEVRGGKAPRIKRLSEYIGESYFDYLAGLPDLVLLMDESHWYRASAGVRAINELKPILGLELTATPFSESSKGPVPFKNVIYHYPLAQAMEDGFVKEPAVVTRKDFNATGMNPDEIERIKLEDGVHLHEAVKVELETYAREFNQPIVKPFILVVAEKITHAKELLNLIESNGFFEGRYKGRAIQVDSSKTGLDEEEMIERLLKVELADDPTEIVIHVNKLKEGWDVTNLYTIIPLRAANSYKLVEQTIGRGLRLPYGKRTGVEAVDRLSIVAHDRFQEIIDEANKPDSAIRLKTIVLDGAGLSERTVTVVSQSEVENLLGITPLQVTSSTTIAGADVAPAFSKPEEQVVARAAYNVIKSFEGQPSTVPSIAHLQRPEVQKEIVRIVEATLAPSQLMLEGLEVKQDVARIVKETVDLVQSRTISIPRIVASPKGEVKSGFNRFDLDLSGMRYSPVSQELYVQYLRTGESTLVMVGRGGIEEKRLEDYVVSGLVDFDEISYDDQSDVLYDLASQVVNHLKTYLDEDQARRVLQVYQKEIARFVHAQMQNHFWEDKVETEVNVSKGFTELRPSAYSQAANEPVVDYKVSPRDKSNYSKYLFGGFKKCAYPVTKFDSDQERIFAAILERETMCWMKPVKSQFQIFFRDGLQESEYQPDFVSETAKTIYICEVKRRNEMEDPMVLAKRESAMAWCVHATHYTAAHGGKPWKYLLIPHDVVAVNMTLEEMEKRWG